MTSCFSINKSAEEIKLPAYVINSKSHISIERGKFVNMIPAAQTIDFQIVVHSDSRPSVMTVDYHWVNVMHYIKVHPLYFLKTMNLCIAVIRKVETFFICNLVIEH